MNTTSNIFEVLGLSDAAELTTKAQMLSAIIKHLRELNMTIAESAELTGVYYPRVMDLLDGKLSKFTTEELTNILSRLENHKDNNE